jgi:putative inorganic carbon (HCO3(-)) transporter
MIAGVIAFAVLSGPLPKAGVIVVALLAATMLLATARRLRAAAMLGALVLSPVLLLASIWNDSELHVVHTHPLEAVIAALVALGVAALVAVWLSRRMQLFGILAVLALPFRVPITVSGQTSNLLVPLYAVVGVGALAWLVPALQRHHRSAYRSRREEEAARTAHPEREAPPRPDPPVVVWLGRLLSVVLVLYGIQAVYSPDFQLALQNMVFFYVPFALLYQLLRQVQWTSELLRRALYAAVGLGLVFSLIGFVEYATKHLLLNSKLETSNNLHAYFAVNSLFFDPDIFGRFLALVMILLAAGLLYRRRGRELTLTVGALAVMWACLILTLSRSSLAALLVGLAVLAALRWKPTRALYVAVAVIALGAVVVAVTPHTFGLEQGFNGVSGGRGGVVTGGIKLFGQRPLQGYGSGAFATEYSAQHQNVASLLSDSHTIPITIAAEQGIIGLIAYVGLLAFAFVVLVRRARGDPVRSAIAAAFAALVFHTLLYADFLEDPFTWALLGVGVALAVAPRRPVGAGADAEAYSAVV